MDDLTWVGDVVVTVRPATAGDKTRSLELIDQLVRDRGARERWGGVYDALLEGERGRVFVADDGGELLGLATVSYNLAIRYGGEYCQLEELIVDPAARGRNVGKLLVEATVAAARGRGCAEYGLYLVESTEGNRPFYEKCGIPYVGSEMRLRLDGGARG